MNMEGKENKEKEKHCGKKVDETGRMGGVSSRQIYTSCQLLAFKHVK